MIDFMSWWVNELWGSAILGLLGILLLYDIIMLLGRLGMMVILIVTTLAFVVFSGLLWGSWITVFVFIFSLIYFGYAVLKFIGPPQ